MGISLHRGSYGRGEPGVWGGGSYTGDLERWMKEGSFTGDL